MELLSEMYRAFNARDIDEVVRYLDPDVDWPNGMEGGRVLGVPAVREYWTRQFGLMNPRVDPVGFEVLPDGRVAVDVHQVVKDLDDVVLVDQMVRHVYEFRDGLVVEMDIS